MAINVQPQLLDRILSLEIVRVTERAAVSAARLRGRGNEMAADQAAVDAMRRELNNLPIRGTVVIGEGERDEAPMLFIGERVGRNTGLEVDIEGEVFLLLRERDVQAVATDRVDRHTGQYL